MLTELERDALTELANIGVGKAAAGLSRMVAEPVHLSVPRAELLDASEAARLFVAGDQAAFVAVRQDFAGPFNGRALLLFPETNSLELVRAVVGPEAGLEEIAELEQEALAEIGNVILNAFIGTIANLLRHRLTVELPDVLRGDAEALFSLPDETGSGGLAALVLSVDFQVRSRDVRGYIAVVMHFSSMAVLQALLHEFVNRVAGEE